MSYGNPLREPDHFDAILYDLEQQFRHERRMRGIRELDIEQWVWEYCDVPGPLVEWEVDGDEM